MTPQQAIDNIAVYSALHNGVLDSSVKVLDKSVKALEIIKEKRVDIYLLLIAIRDEQENGNDGLNFYNRNLYHFKFLTQEQFNLLKEVLK